MTECPNGFGFTAGYKAYTAYSFCCWGMWNNGAVRVDWSQDKRANEKEDYFC